MPAKTAACRQPVTRGWPPERRARQRSLIQQWRPWRKTKGPKTTEGKAKSAQNALKHGLYTRKTQEEFRAFRLALRRCRQSIAIARAYLRVQKSKRARPAGTEKNSSEVLERTGEPITSLARDDPRAPSPPPATRAFPSGCAGIRSDRARSRRARARR
jgi:hypothetical protein